MNHFECRYCGLEISRIDDCWVARSEDETVDEWECAESPSGEHTL